MQVCGLKWDPSGTQLASGGNDNALCIWEASQHERPLHSWDHHLAAVKAIGWAPWQRGVLASGGGSQDRTLRFWHTGTGECTHSVNTGSQVCGLTWAKHTKQLVTSHGYADNQLSVWNFPSLARVADLTGHTSRVLHMTISPDGRTVASAAGDETLRFWKVFEGQPVGRKPSAVLEGRQSRASRFQSVAIR